MTVELGEGFLLQLSEYKPFLGEKIEKYKNQKCDNCSCDYGFAYDFFDSSVSCQVSAIALRTDAVFGVTGQIASDFNTGDFSLDDRLADFFGNQFIAFCQDLLGLWMKDILARIATNDAVI